MKPSFELLLPSGDTTLVDTDMAEHLSSRRWYLRRFCNGYRYVYSGYRNGEKPVALHRFILNAPDDTIVDHINRNTLDNRRSNLRICTASENAANRGMSKNSTSPFKGLHFCNNKWVAVLKFNSIKHYLGRFANPVDAALAYDEAAKRIVGKFAVLNFPELHLPLTPTLSRTVVQKNQSAPRKAQ